MFDGTIHWGRTRARGERARGRWRIVAALVLMIPLVATPRRRCWRAGRGAAADRRTLPVHRRPLRLRAGLLACRELAVAEINAGGGVNGQPIELVQGDTATSPQQAVEEAPAPDRVGGCLGHHRPGGQRRSAAGRGIGDRPGRGPPVISPSATSPALTVANDNDFFFRTTISDARPGRRHRRPGPGAGLRVGLRPLRQQRLWPGAERHLRRALHRGRRHGDRASAARAGAG